MITKVATLCALVAAVDADICTAESNAIGTASGCADFCTKLGSFEGCLNTQCRSGKLVGADGGQAPDLRAVCHTMMNQLDPILTGQNCPLCTSINCDEIPTDCSKAIKAMGAGIIVLIVLCGERRPDSFPCGPFPLRELSIMCRRAQVLVAVGALASSFSRCRRRRGPKLRQMCNRASTLPRLRDRCQGQSKPGYCVAAMCTY
jgi:hypothetical protein